ncbi:hypothetical protein Q5P01_022261 [Channa striata]|uniref:Uncharacterized protein n=1 Tax=Channa striata TaxID=64152 RepID=A0AA88J4U4_CHASR|nr:hypothetical protein Q5P01_022261 [Channa striata]
MYASGYSQVNKSGPAAQRKMHRSKGKSCGYYMRIVFFFSSLIQSLIIVSLVLFLVYGKKEDSASTVRIRDLESTFSQLSIENVALRQQRKNLTNLLNVTLTNKARNDFDLDRFRNLINISAVIIQELDKKLHQCNNELYYCKLTPQCPSHCQTGYSLSNCNCGLQFEQQKARCQLLEANFTQTVQRIRIETEQIARDRDSVTLESIQLRKDKSILTKELEFHKEGTPGADPQQLHQLVQRSGGQAPALPGQKQLRQLNISCSSRTGSGVSTYRVNPPTQSGWNSANSGGSSSVLSSSSGVGGQPVRTGSSVFNKPVSTGTGSSSSSVSLFGSNSGLSSLGSVFNKPTSTGTGSSSSSLSPGSSPSLSSTGSGLNKPGSAGGTFPSFGSTGSNPSLNSGGTSLNKPVVNTRGSSTTGLSSGSTGPNPNLNLSGVGLNKPTSNVRSSTGTGSAGSALSWFGLGSSSSGQSRTGTGTSHSGTGSSSSGRTNGPASGSNFVNQHLQDLYHVINPPRPEDKKDISRILG